MNTDFCTRQGPPVSIRNKTGILPAPKGLILCSMHKYTQVQTKLMLRDLCILYGLGVQSQVNRRGGDGAGLETIVPGKQDFTTAVANSTYTPLGV